MRFIEEFDQPSPLVLWDIAPFDQIKGRHGRKQILFPQEADVIRNDRFPLPQIPYVQILLKKAHALKNRLDSTPGLTQTALAQELGISRVRVTQILNLLKLEPEIQRGILALPPLHKERPDYGTPTEIVGSDKDWEAKICLIQNSLQAS